MVFNEVWYPIGKIFPPEGQEVLFYDSVFKGYALGFFDYKYEDDNPSAERIIPLQYKICMDNNNICPTHFKLLDEPQTLNIQAIT